jgi:hypothetical protein
VFPARSELACQVVLHTASSGKPRYTNNQGVKEWARVFSVVLQKELIQLLIASPVLAFQLDESSDVTKCEQLILYVSYIRTS